MKLINRFIKNYLSKDSEGVKLPNTTPYWYSVEGLGKYDGRLTEGQYKKILKSTFYKCLEIRANAMAEALTQATVERRTTQDMWEMVESDHPWVTLLSRPSRIMSSHDFYYYLSMTRDLHGATYFFIARDRYGVPIELRPLPINYGSMSLLLNEVGDLVYYIFTRSDGKELIFEAEDILKIMRTNPNSLHEGLSLTQVLAYTIQSDIHTREYTVRTLQEGGVMGTVMSTDQNLTEAQVRQYTELLKSKIKGLKNLSEVGILGSGLQPVQFHSPPADMDVFNTNKLNFEDILFVTGVPKGLFESATTRATAEAARLVLFDQTIQPESESIAGQLSLEFERLFKAEENKLLIRPPDLRPLDAEFELRKEQAEFESGQWTINELKKRKGEDEIGPEGDKRYLRAGLVPLDRVGKSPFDFTDERSTRQTPNPFKLVVHKRSAHIPLTEEDLRMEWREVDNIKQRNMLNAFSAVRNVLAFQHREIINNLGEKFEGRSITDTPLSSDELFNLSEQLEYIRNILNPVIADIIASGFQTANLRIGVDTPFNMDRQGIRDAFDSIMSKTEMMAGTTKDSLERMLQKGMSEGWDVNKLKDNIKEYFDAASVGRAGTVAQTVTHSSFEAGQQDSFEAAGVDTKRWLTQRDGVVRPSHQEADGQETGLKNKYNIGGEDLEYPGDPNGSPWNTINCRCTSLPIIT